jgi:hypothetical protein
MSKELGGVLESEEEKTLHHLIREHINHFNSINLIKENLIGSRHTQGRTAITNNYCSLLRNDTE